MQPARMTWEEVKRAYPDEWVILIDLDEDDELPHVRGGVVAGHSRSHNEVLATTSLRVGEHWALKFTGRRVGAYALLLDKLSRFSR